MNLTRAVQVSMDTAIQPCEDGKVIVYPGRWVDGQFCGTLGGFVGVFMDV
ncbi:hypothetical protein K443DRAFT_16112 [Laccaria amethystina LaAM-08-1]|uniref:Uncharacterized protein n=1 Tax=Laccaria amethystina LaAM-08-1 TaxID=1095629 RepID=A0A0C9WYE9_9AGAR|nr:hypothetical protein K443DRAFT_16112 [Laccaria amethystina LaAM-08-1]